MQINFKLETYSMIKETVSKNICKSKKIERTCYKLHVRNSSTNYTILDQILKEFFITKCSSENVEHCWIRMD